MTRDEAIKEELRRIGDKAWPGHDSRYVQKIRVRTLLRLRGLTRAEHLRHADLYQLDHERALEPVPA